MVILRDRITGEIREQQQIRRIIPNIELSRIIFEFIVKIVKDNNYIYILIPNISHLTMKQRHHKIGILITWLLMIMKRFTTNEELTRYNQLFDNFERMINLHMMNIEWFTDPINQLIVSYLLRQWLYFKYIPHL